MSFNNEYMIMVALFDIYTMMVALGSRVNEVKFSDAILCAF